MCKIGRDPTIIAVEFLTHLTSQSNVAHNHHNSLESIMRQNKSEISWTRDIWKLNHIFCAIPWNLHTLQIWSPLHTHNTYWHTSETSLTDKSSNGMLPINSLSCYHMTHHNAVSSHDHLQMADHWQMAVWNNTKCCPSRWTIVDVYSCICLPL